MTKDKFDGLYRSQRFDSSVANALSESAVSDIWDDWDLMGLMDEVPCDFAKRLGVNYGIFTSSGTSALHAALLALQIQPGDEVIVPCTTFIRAVTPLLHLGVTPVLADVDPETGNISPEGIQSAVSTKTRGIIVVHQWGTPANMDEILHLSNRFNLPLIEDFSHAHLTEYKTKPVGGIGTIGIASLQRKKVLSVGEGGLVVSNDHDIYERLKDITSPGSFRSGKSEVDYSGYGLNMRMSPFSCIAAKCIFENAEDIVKRREKNVSELVDILKESSKIQSPNIPDYATRVSPYGFKPRLINVSFDEATDYFQSTPWRLKRYSYGEIGSSKFWTKSRAYFPFCQNIRPRRTKFYTGFKEYMEGRISLGIPSVDSNYWNEETRSIWREPLENW